jgi:hypothetical protein
VTRFTPRPAPSNSLLLKAIRRKHGLLSVPRVASAFAVAASDCIPAVTYMWDFAKRSLVATDRAWHAAMELARRSAISQGARFRWLVTYAPRTSISLGACRHRISNLLVGELIDQPEQEDARSCGPDPRGADR